MQRSRRTNPYPHTWEIPVVGVIAVLFLLLLGLQAGRSVANLLAGNGWVFVPREGLFTSLGGCFGGDAASGLTGVSRPGIHRADVDGASPSSRSWLWSGAGGWASGHSTGGGRAGCRGWPPPPRRRRCWAAPDFAGTPRSSGPTCTGPPRRAAPGEAATTG